MSRRASFFARQHPGQRRVRFPDEIIFDECVKDSDPEMVISMLRRVSLDIDVNRINMAGMTALHQAVLDDNLVLVNVLVSHGANVNMVDIDSWTPLHGAAANGHTEVAQYLIKCGANTKALTDDGETPLDLVEADDFSMMAILLNTKEEVVKRRMSLSVTVAKKVDPAWVRRASVQEDQEKRNEQLKLKTESSLPVIKSSKIETKDLKKPEVEQKSEQLESAKKTNSNQPKNQTVAIERHVIERQRT